MTFESVVAANAKRSIWVRARDRAETTGTALPWLLDYDGGVLSKVLWDQGIGPKANTSAHPALSARSLYYDTGASSLSCGSTQMVGIVNVFATNTLSGTNPAMAFNGTHNVADFWASNGTLSPIGVQFATAFVCTGYTMWGRSDTPSQAPKDWTFQGSNDGATWNTLDTRAGETAPSGVHYTFTNSNAYAYYRINPTALQSGTLVAISNIDIDGAPHRTNHSGTSGEVWIVRKSNVAGSSAPGKTGTSGENYVPYTDGKVYYSVGSSARSDDLTVSGVTWTNWHILRLVKRASGVQELWVDGVLKHSANTGAAAWSAFVLLGGGFSGSNPNEHHAEEIHANAVLTDTEAGEWFDYLTDTHFSAVTPPAITGTGSTTAPTPGAEGTGTSTTTGTGSATAPAPGAQGSGTSTTTGTGSATAPAPGAQGEGTSDQTAIGTGSATAPTPGAEGTGTSTTTGAGDATAPTPGPSGSGSSTTTGTGDAAAPTPGAEGTGTSGATIAEGTATAPVPGAEGTGITEVVDAPGWDFELTGQCLVGVDTDEVYVRVVPPTATPPAGLTQTPLVRTSYRMPRVTADNYGRLLGLANPDPENPLEYEVFTEVVGYPHVWIGGVDRTYDADGILADVDDMVVQRGTGDQTATVNIRGMQLWHDDGLEPFEWIRGGVDVEAGFVREDGSVHYWWAGDLLDKNRSADAQVYRVSRRAFGPMLGLAAIQHQPDFAMDTVEMGTYLTRLVNGVIGRTYATVRTPRNPRLAVPNANPGAIGESVRSHLLAMLAKSWSGMRPWAFIPDQQERRRHRLERVNVEDVHWTYTAGAPGVKFSLDEDWSEVINCYWGRGVTKDGHRWLKFRYPNYLPYAAPEYFSANPSAVLTVGTTDADTRNNGVSLYQRRLQELGYHVKVDGIFNTADRDVTFRVQRDRGLQRDGVVGGQTWSSVWSVGSTAALLKMVRRPLAVDPRVEPYLYLPNGAIAGVNPDYDATIPRRETEIDYGARTTLEEGEADAAERLERTKDPVLEGTMLLTSCPWEGTRWEIDAAQNIKLLGLGSLDPFLHIAQVKRSPRKGTVEVVVSTALEDALTVLERRKHNAASRQDPARRPGVYGRTSSSTMLDSVTPFDGDSPAGRIVEIPLRGGLWTEWPVPFTEIGTLQKVYARTYGPAARFSLQLSALRPTPAAIQLALGNVLEQERPWESPAVKRFLDRFGHIDGWGQVGQALGYEQGRESSGAELNGIFETTSGVEFRMPKPMMSVWVYADRDCFFTLELSPKAVA